MSPKENKEAVFMRIASPQVVKQWSRGEVKEPAYVGVGTSKPIQDGLFCEKIFGPAEDYKICCDNYEVTEITRKQSQMGHIKLTCPVAHVLFTETIRDLLDMSPLDLEKVLYYEEYIVIDSGNTTLKNMELLSEDKYVEYKKRFGGRFIAKIGAEAIKDLLVRKSFNKCPPKMKIGRGFAELILDQNNKPEWMVVDLLPVIPPFLRPLVNFKSKLPVNRIDSFFEGKFKFIELKHGFTTDSTSKFKWADSDVNDLYLKVINRNNRLSKLLAINAPEIIIRNQKRMIQEAVDSLFCNGRHGHITLDIIGDTRPLVSLGELLVEEQIELNRFLLLKGLMITVDKWDARLIQFFRK